MHLQEMWLCLAAASRKTESLPRMQNEEVGEMKKRGFYPLPRLEYLRECFDLDESCGSGLRWRIRPAHHFTSEHASKRMNSRFAGTPAGCRARRSDKKGDYWVVKMKESARGLDHAHRILWFMKTGVDPRENTIDHRDGNPENNLFSNLRLASFAQNSFNSKRAARKHAKGVTYIKGRNLYLSRLTISFGLYETEEEAASVYRKAAEIIQKEFAVHLSRPDELAHRNETSCGQEMREAS